MLFSRGDIRDFQGVTNPLARNPTVHPGDVFEDRAVQLRPGHAEEAYQHLSAHYQHRSAGGPEDVGVVQVVPAPPGRRFAVLRIDHLCCPVYLRELRIARPGPPLPGELPGDRMVHGSDELQ